MSVVSTLRHRLDGPTAKDLERAWIARCEPYRAAREAGPPKDDARVTRWALDGVKWYVPHPDRGLGRLLSRSRRLPSLFEIEQTGRLGARGDTMLDIGANIGTTSIPRVVNGHFRRALVAEPAELDYRCLVHNVAATRVGGRVLPDNCAIYSSTGVVRFREKSQSGVHRITERKRGRDVPSFTLDDWLDRCDVAARHVDFIKCDAQGAEGHIFQGGEALLGARRVIWQIEYWPSGLAALGTTGVELRDMIRHWFTDFVLLGRRGDDSANDRIRPIAELESAIADLQLGAKGFTNLLLYPSSYAAIRGSSQR